MELITAILQSKDITVMCLWAIACIVVMVKVSDRNRNGGNVLWGIAIFVFESIALLAGIWIIASAFYR